MASVLKLTPTSTTINVGNTQKFTASLTGVPEGGNTTYVWTVDGAPQASTTDTMEYKATKVGTNVIKVVSTTKVQDVADDIQEASVSVNVNKNTMTVSVLASTTTTTIALGETYSIKCDVTGQPPSATITYKWDSGETTQTITGAGSVLGPMSRKCTVTVKATDYDDYVGDSNTVTITVIKKTQTSTGEVVTSTPNIKVGDTYKAQANVSDFPVGALFTYKWNTGEKVKSISKVAETEGEIKLKCTITVKADDYFDKVIETEEVTITVEALPVPEEPGCIRYIHPLDHRSSAYIWAGWWVMYEIEAAVKAGIDWKKPDGTELKYKCDLKTLAKMLEDYPNVEVQESKHGYILNKETIEAGYIY